MVQIGHQGHNLVTTNWDKWGQTGTIFSMIVSRLSSYTLYNKTLARLYYFDHDKSI